MCFVLQDLRVVAVLLNMKKPGSRLCEHKEVPARLRHRLRGVSSWTKSEER